MDYLISQGHPEWHDALKIALSKLDSKYLEQLAVSGDWLPRPHSILAAFSQSLSSTKYILLGESPYPRISSANGYAFWDNDVGSLWSEKGFSKQVNRATSLRNLMKMFLLARGALDEDLSQAAIAKLDKSGLIQTAESLFNKLMSRGFLLLNASLVYSEGAVPYHAKQWRPFIQSILEWLAEKKPTVELILWGKIADQIPRTTLSIGLQAEHPYNLSFIRNPNVLEFFKPMDILNNHE